MVVNSLCFPSQFGCTQDVPKYEYNPDKAKTLLAEAGYPKGFEIPFLAYRNRDFAEAMINNLNSVGIKTKFGIKYAAFRDRFKMAVPHSILAHGARIQCISYHKPLPIRWKR